MKGSVAMLHQEQACRFAAEAGLLAHLTGRLSVESG